MCLSRALPLQLKGNQKLEEETSETLILLIKTIDGLRSSQFQRVHLNDIPIVEDLQLLKNLLYEFYIVEKKNNEELASKSVHKYENTVRLLRYNNRICYMNNNIAVF